MVSTFRYWSFKEIDFARRRPPQTLLVVVLAIMIVATHARRASSSSLFGGYALSRPGAPRSWARRHAERSQRLVSREQGSRRHGRALNRPQRRESETGWQRTGSRCCRGDGIGQEVTPEARARARARSARRPGTSFEFERGAGRRCRHRRHGQAAAAEHARALPAASTPSCSASVGGPKWDDVPQEQRPERGLLALAQGARPLRQPAPGHVLSDARRRLAAQALGGRGHRHHGHPRADRRPLLRRAAGRGALRRRRRARDQHDGRTPRARSSAWPGSASTSRASADEAPDLGGQGQRAGRVAALARGRDPRGQGLSRT